MEPRNDRHILIVRTDRIGDVLLTLPVAAALRKHDPGTRLTMWVREYTRELVEGQCGVSGVLLDDEAGVRRPFVQLVRELRRARIDVALVAYPRLRIAAALWAARVPVRIGTGYRWYSFLFNRRVFEHRKEGKKSEAAYNLGLLAPFGIRIDDRPSAAVTVSAAHRRSASALRRSLGIRDRDCLVILHPGSGGSARDWPEERFGALAGALERRGCRVLIVGTEAERPLVERISRFGGSNVIPLIGGQSLMEYAALIRTAALVVANSTGPLHLAAAVGTPVIGFFPNDRIMGSVRWGPLTTKKAIFTPKIEGCLHCAGGTCRVHTSMELIEVGSVVVTAEKILGLRSRAGGKKARRLLPRKRATRPRADGRRVKRSKR